MTCPGHASKEKSGIGFQLLALRWARGLYRGVCFSWWSPGRPRLTSALPSPRIHKLVIDDVRPEDEGTTRLCPMAIPCPSRPSSTSWVRCLWVSHLHRAQMLPFRIESCPNCTLGGNRG